GDDVARAGLGGADEIIGGVEEDSGTAVAQRVRAGKVGANQVALNYIAISSRDLDAVHAIGRNEIARARVETADGVLARPANVHAAKAVAQPFLPIRIGAHEVPFNDIPGRK